VTPEQKSKLLEMRAKRLKQLSDEELEQKLVKNINKWTFSAYEVEWARRRAEEYMKFFEVCK